MPSNFVADQKVGFAFNPSQFILTHSIQLMFTNPNVSRLFIFPSCLQKFSVLPSLHWNLSLKQLPWLLQSGTSLTFPYWALRSLRAWVAPAHTPIKHTGNPDGHRGLLQKEAGKGVLLPVSSNWAWFRVVRCSWSKVWL